MKQELAKIQESVNENLKMLIRFGFTFPITSYNRDGYTIFKCIPIQTPTFFAANLLEASKEHEQVVYQTENVNDDDVILKLTESIMFSLVKPY